MFADTLVRVLRDGGQIYPRIAVQLDTSGHHESTYAGGASPYFRYRAYVMGKYDIRQQDLLVDLAQIDPETKAYTQYRVTSKPKYFSMDNHMQFVVDHIQGT